MEPACLPIYSYEEYLALDDHANVRHEFVDGRIYAMAGGTPEHAARIVNVASALHVQLRGKGCRVYSSDLRIRVRETGLASYPDIVVIYGALQRDEENVNTALNPTLIVEALSPSTAEYDRGDKLENYKRISSLREVVLIDHEVVRIEVWTRTDSGVWRLAEHRSGAIELTVDARLDVADAYYEASPRTGSA